ncbi:MAG: hypothetical protein LBT15_06160 [Synergistaceae bacterium]|nr:hypothetical protein [Synergistaceae bacterium]
MPDEQRTDAQNQPATDVEKTPEAGQTAPDMGKEPAKYGALKGCFHSPRRGDTCGAFCLLIDASTGEILENVFWVTYSSSESVIDVDLGWREFNKAIPDMGPYEKSLGDKLNTQLPEVFSVSARMDLLQHPEDSSRLAVVEEDIRKSFERATHYFLEFHLVLERLSRQNLVDAGVLQPGEDKPASESSTSNEDEKKSFEGTLINCLPVIDPVRGCPVSELQPGDMVEVKIQGGVGASGLIEQYLASTKQDAVFPVQSVEQKSDDKVYVFLSINEEIRGLITLTKDLRLRTLRMDRDKKRTLNINMDNLIFFGTFFVATIVILLVIRFLFF